VVLLKEGSNVIKYVYVAFVLYKLTILPNLLYITKL